MNPLTHILNNIYFITLLIVPTRITQSITLIHAVHPRYYLNLTIHDCFLTSFLSLKRGLTIFKKTVILDIKSSRCGLKIKY